MRTANGLLEPDLNLFVGEDYFLSSKFMRCMGLTLSSTSANSGQFAF